MAETRLKLGPCLLSPCFGGLICLTVYEVASLLSKATFKPGHIQNWWENSLKRQIYRHCLQKVRLDGFPVGTRKVPFVVSPSADSAIHGSQMRPLGEALSFSVGFPV